MSTFLRLAPVFLCGFVGFGCGSGGASPAEPEPVRTAEAPSPVIQSDGASLHEECVAGFQRMRTCTDVYIPALVGLRVEHDVPPGIAAKDAELGRDVLVARAMEEWETDSTDAAFEELCGQIVSGASQEDQARMLEVADRCGSTGTCEEFVECILPSLAMRFGAPPPQ
jgi:hypothetical protein